CMLRRVGAPAAAVPARHGVELLSRHRCAGAGDRGRVGPVARPLLRRAHLRRPGHDRHSLLSGRNRRRKAARAIHLRDGRDGDAMGGEALRPPTSLSGGGGLVGTAGDYHRFAQMLLRGGELDGVRLLGSRTVRYMTCNHLPGGVDLESFGRPLFSETTFNGVGFGLGFSVMQNPVHNRVLSTPGEFAWGGAASTAFWVDPAERITAMFFTQLLPSSTLPIRGQLRQLVYQALVD